MPHGHGDQDCLGAARACIELQAVFSQLNGPRRADGRPGPTTGELVMNETCTLGPSASSV
jgi:hypothetical protein